jgi:hypothetical protein
MTIGLYQIIFLSIALSLIYVGKVSAARKVALLKLIFCSTSPLKVSNRLKSLKLP